LSQSSGMVWLVGAGPGDPGLFTLRGRQILERADVIVYDRLASPRLLKYARPDAERVYVGKQSSRHTLTQDEINAVLVDRGLKGLTVCRLKGGDPFIFGRGGEEAEACRAAGISFGVVPGVTSAIAAPAYAGIPVTHRGLCTALGIITGHEDPTKGGTTIRWDGLAKGLDTLVFLMGVENLPNIVQQLTEQGKSPDTPVALVRWGSTTRQETLVGTLANIVQRVRETGFKAPAVTVVGEVVRLRESLQWFDNRPLFGRTVVVTRAREQASDLADTLETLGAETIEFPTIRTEATPEADTSPILGCLPLDYDWIIFTSANTVPFLLNALRVNGGDVRSLGGSKIAAIGPGTSKALTDLGLTVDYVPTEFVAESVAAGFPVDPFGLRILLPRAEIAREVLPEALADRGAEVTILPVYRTLPDTDGVEDLRTRLAENTVDVVTFTSSSTVRNFHAAVGDVPMDGVFIACIGPITASTARELGYNVGLVSESYSISGLVDALVSHYAKVDGGV